MAVEEWGEWGDALGHSRYTHTAAAARIQSGVAHVQPFFVGFS
jgi:hypothetical protein